MKYEQRAVADAAGLILAHSMRVPGGRIKKGQSLTEQNIRALLAAGATRVFVAVPGSGDIGENVAARTLARALAGAGVEVGRSFTGRCNLRARCKGVLQLQVAALNNVNRVHESLTVATLAPFSTVTEGECLATIKIIPFAVARQHLESALLSAEQSAPLLRVAAFQSRRVGLIQTRLSAMRRQVLSKASQALEKRLQRLGCVLVREVHCQHDERGVAAAIAELHKGGAELIVVVGASATVGRGDVVPSAIELAGGTVVHHGMPVDPGNLLLLADVAGLPLVCAPGSARSPRRSGFDVVLERLVAGIPISGADIMDMGVGGLLKEISSRPVPRGMADVAGDSGNVTVAPGGHLPPVVKHTLS